MPTIYDFEQDSLAIVPLGRTHALIRVEQGSTCARVAPSIADLRAAIEEIDPEPTEEERVATELTKALEGQRVGMDIAKSIAERLAAQGWRKTES